MAMARSRRNGTVFAVGLLDLDDFKAVNDQFGHDAGDRLLIELVERLVARLRESDFLVRLGGDEFIIVIEGLTEELLPEQLNPFLSRLHEVVESPFIVSEGQQAFVGMSLGLAFYPLDAVIGAALVRQADIAMYALKKEKGRRTVWWQRTDQSFGMVDLSGPVKSFDPYGQDVKALLGRYKPEIATVMAKVVANFFGQMAMEAEPAVIFSSLSAEAMSTLKIRQFEHLKFLLDPETTRESLSARAAEVGRIHCLVGVGMTLLQKGKSLYIKLLKEYLDQAIPDSTDRNDLLVTAGWRLHEDNEFQLRSEVTTMDHYMNTLSLPLFQKGTNWTDARNTEIRQLGDLPGVQAVFLAIPDSHGVFLVEENAGPVGELGSFLLRNQEIWPVLDPSSPLGQGLLSRAWRSLHFQTTPSFYLDPTFAPWMDLLTRLEIQSGMVLLVRDDSKRPVALIAMYGGYPNQFESPWMKQFAMGIEQRWEKVWRLSQH
jgi:diguanylate cyclase (GGDEF)-like protein